LSGKTANGADDEDARPRNVIFPKLAHGRLQTRGFRFVFLGWRRRTNYGSATAQCEDQNHGRQIVFMDFIVEPPLQSECGLFD
jgi:hypothetical protein